MQSQTCITDNPPPTMKYIYWAFTHSNWAFLYIGKILIDQRKKEIIPPDIMFPILVALALAESIAIFTNFKFQPFLLRLYYKPTTGPTTKGQDPILVYAIVLWAFCQSISIYGLVWIMLGGAQSPQISFVMLSLLSFWLANPKAIIEQIKKNSSKTTQK